MSQFPPPQQPMYQTPPAAKPAGMATASMILGIVSVVLFCVWYLSVPCAILAVVFGVIARGRFTRGEGGGGGMAKAGIILGIVNFVLVALIAILAVVGFSLFGTEIQKQMQIMQQQQQQQMQRQSGGGTGPATPVPTTSPSAWQ